MVQKYILQLGFGEGHIWPFSPSCMHACMHHVHYQLQFRDTEGRKNWRGIFVLENLKKRPFLFLAVYDNIALKGCHGWRLETVQDFLIKLDIKPCMHQVEISIFSLNNFIRRPTKIIKDLCKVST